MASWIWRTGLAKGLHKGRTAWRLYFVAWVELRSSVSADPAASAGPASPQPVLPAQGAQPGLPTSLPPGARSRATIYCTFQALEVMCRLPSVSEGPPVPDGEIETKCCGDPTECRGFGRWIVREAHGTRRVVSVDLSNKRLYGMFFLNLFLLFLLMHFGKNILERNCSVFLISSCGSVVFLSPLYAGCGVLKISGGK